MQFITTLAGHQFAKTEAKVALDEFRRFDTPATFFLRRNPSNAFDANAIEVYLSNTDGTEYFIGHVAAADAANIAPYLDNDQDYRDNSGNPLWTEDHTPEVIECRIIDWVSGEKKPTILIEISTGYELGTLVRGQDDDGDGDDDYLPNDE